MLRVVAAYGERFRLMLASRSPRVPLWPEPARRPTAIRCAAARHLSRPVRAGCRSRPPIEGREQEAPPSTQNWAQNGWLRRTDVCASGKSAPELELRIVGQQRTGDHDRMIGVLAFDDHPRGSRTSSARAGSQDAPAARGDLRHVDARVSISGNSTSAPGSCCIDRVWPRLRTAPRSRAERAFRLVPQRTAGHMNAETVAAAATAGPSSIGRQVPVRAPPRASPVMK